MCPDERAVDPEKLWQEIAELKQRVARLEAGGVVAPPVYGVAPGLGVPPQGPPILGQPTLGPPPIAPPVAGSPVFFAGPPPGSPPGSPPAPPPAPPPASPRRAGQGFERRLGSQIFNRLGILILLIGVAYFLKLAFDNGWIGPLGRIVVGLVAGVAIVLWSERFRAKNYAVFSYSLKALGSGVLYLSLWAAFAVYHLVPGWAAFGAMIAVTLWNGFMAWAQDAELLAVYALAGGLSTPLLLSTGSNQEVSLFSYLLLLSVASVVLAALRPWGSLIAGSFLGALGFFIGWSIRFYSVDQFATTAVLVGIFVLLYAISAPLHLRSMATGVKSTTAGASLETPPPARRPRLEAMVPLLPLFNAAAGFLGFYLLFDSRNWNTWLPWLAVVFGAIYLMMPTSIDKLVRDPGMRLRLQHVHLSIAVIALVLAIPLKTQGHWLTIGWMVEAAVLLWLAARFNDYLLRALGCITLTLGLVMAFPLLRLAQTQTAQGFFNQAFATDLVTLAALAFIIWTARRSSTRERSAWGILAGLCIIAFNLTAICSGLIQLMDYWWGGWSWQNLGQAAAVAGYQHREALSQFSYSAWLALYGAALLVAGFWRRSSFLRIQGLALLVFTIAKVFIFDVSHLSQSYKVVSFLGLGALLLAVSFVYQRDWLNLRKQQGPPA